MAKTPEEIKQLVLMEFERLEYKPIRGYNIAITDIPALGVRKWAFQRSDKFTLGFIDGFGDFNGGALTFCHSLSASDPFWHLAYRLLNLEVRELEERAQGLVYALEMGVERLDQLSDGYSASCGSGIPSFCSNLGDTFETALNQWKGVQHV